MRAASITPYERDFVVIAVMVLASSNVAVPKVYKMPQS